MEKLKDVHSRSQAVKSNTPLHLAAMFGKIQKVSKLHLETPLHMAVLSKNVELVKHLIVHGAEVDVEDSSFGTPLHFASTMGYPKIVRELLRGGANVNGLPKWSNTPLHCVIVGRRYLDQKYTMKEYPSSFPNSKLTTVEIENRIEIIDTLLNEGAELNHFQGYETPLHVSVKHNLISLSERLIDRGAKIDLFDQRGKTVMYYASINCSRKHVELLLNAGANVNAKTLKIGDLTKYTPLQNAVYYNDERVASVLINAGADLNDVGDAFCQQRMTSSLFHLLVDSGAQIIDPGSALRSTLNNFFVVNDNNDKYASLFDRFLDLNSTCPSTGLTTLGALSLSPYSTPSDSTQCVIKLIVKMESANEFKMNPMDSELITTRYFTLYNQYKKELELLKKTNIGGDIKLYDLLVQPFRKLAGYSRNLELIRNLDSGVCAAFPAYGGFIESRMRFAHKRKVLLEKCLKTFSELISPITLDRFVGLHVLSYLNLSNLQSLSRV